jgi:hypothetical protein
MHKISNGTYMSKVTMCRCLPEAFSIYTCGLDINIRSVFSISKCVLIWTINCMVMSLITDTEK